MYDEGTWWEMRRNEKRYRLGQLKSALQFRGVPGNIDNHREAFLENHPLICKVSCLFVLNISCSMSSGSWERAELF